MATDKFINVRELVPQLLKFKQDNPKKKIAFCFSGGGARGAYFGGVIEAIQQEISKHPQQATLPLEQRWKPDMICGTSAGALAGFAYWMECLLPSNPSPYACRQTNVWKSISDGNKGAQKLFNNPSIIDFLSKSSVELDNFLDALDQFKTDINPIIENLDEQWTDIKLIISNSASFDINRFQNGIQDKVDSIHERINKVGEKPKLKDALEWAENVIKLIGEVSTFVPAISVDLGKMQLDQAKNLLQNIKDLNYDIKDGRKNDIKKVLKDFKDLTYKLQDLYKELKIVFDLTKFHIKESSSLMNTGGLEKILEKFIFDSFPKNTFPLVNGKIEARELDSAIIKLVKESREKIPDLFLTGTNINAKRGVAFSLAMPEVNDIVADRNLWVVKLDEVGVDFSSHKMAASNEFVFGGGRFGSEFSHATDLIVDQHNQNSTDLINNMLSGNVTVIKETLVNPRSKIKVTPPKKEQTIDNNLNSPNAKNSTAVAAKPANFVSSLMDFTKGRSLFVGAVLTSSSIPIAFPPRQWTFFSKTKEMFKHWMVDGGIVDNRPIDVAVKAGAKFIVSFELTPLLSATTEMKRIFDEQPKFMEVISKSMIDASLNAGFYRYFEDLVTKNKKKPKYTIYRMAPEMYNTPDDLNYDAGQNLDEHTIGTYDFNGKFDNERNFRMGLFDWFMKGYIDAKGGDNIDMSDPVNKAYNELPENFGAAKNAYKGRRSGFYNATLKAHPDTAAPW